MTKYSLEFDKKFIKELEAIPVKFRKNIEEKIEALKSNLRPDGVKKLKGSKNEPLYRVRCGDYRIIYVVRDKVLIVLLMDVGHRREVFR